MKWKGQKEGQSYKLLDHVEALELDAVGKKENGIAGRGIDVEARIHHQVVLHILPLGGCP